MTPTRETILAAEVDRLERELTKVSRAHDRRGRTLDDLRKDLAAAQQERWRWQRLALAAGVREDAQPAPSPMRPGPLDDVLYVGGFDFEAA